MQNTCDRDECGREDHIRKAVLLSGNTSRIIKTLGCSAEVLSSIAKTCDHVLDHGDPIINSLEHSEALNRLERRLVNAKQYIGSKDEPEKSSQHKSARQVAELYRLAGLIYLYRAGKKLSSNDSKVKKAVDAGLDIAAGLKICSRAFPLVIIGCEARCDKDRLAILDTFRRTQNFRKTGNLIWAQRLIEASWAQDDLHTEEELDYVQKLNAIMSMSRYLPSFA